MLEAAIEGKRTSRDYAILVGIASFLQDAMQRRDSHDIRRWRKMQLLGMEA